MTEPSAPTTDPALERRWEAVRAKLLANFDRLAERGSLASSTSASGRRVWAVRFADTQDGRPVHRNIYVGGDDSPSCCGGPATGSNGAAGVRRRSSGWRGSGRRSAASPAASTPGWPPPASRRHAEPTC